MAHSKSAKKRIKISERNRLQNKSLKNRFKTTVKKVEENITNNNIELAQDLFKLAQKNIDKAAIRGAIHRNKASRQKSKLARHLNKAIQK